MTEENTAKNDRLSLWIGMGALVVLGSYLLGWWAMNRCIDTPAERGQFGDMFGSLNALFSALALIALIYTVLLQRKDLALQREEMRLSVEELKRSATAQEETQQEIRRQTEVELHAAKINALSTLLEYTRQMERMAVDTGNPLLWDDARDKPKWLSALRAELEKLEKLG